MNDKIIFMVLAFIVRTSLRISYVAWCLLMVFWLLDYKVDTIKYNDEDIVVIKYKKGKQHEQTN